MKSATLVSRIPQTSSSSARQYPKIAPRPSTSHAQNVGYIISGATFGPNTQFVDANGNPVMFVQAGSSDETIVTHSYTQPVQYPSSSHAYSSASTSQHEFNEFVRSCPECKEKFPTLKALKSHIDKCLITSFENEVINTMTSLPNLQLEGDYDSSFIHRPLLEDEMGSPELATMEPIRQEHRYDTEPTDIFDDFPELESNFNDIDDALESQTSGSPADFDLKPSPKRLAQIRKRKLAEDIKLSQLNGFRDRINDDILLVENTQTVESRKGLKLLVSVKRPKIIKSEQIPGPSSSMEQEEDDELDILQRPSTSKNEDLLETGVNRTRYKVIGALANADTTANDVKMECPTCGLRLYKHNFSAHYRIHTGDLPYDCKYCDKKFRTTSAQKVHMRCHTGEKPYQCPKCPYACITKRNLDRHIINNHVRKNADGTTNQPRFRKSKYYRPETDFRIETGQEEPEEYFVMYDANNFNEALEAVENNDLRKLKRILNHYLVRAQDQEGTSILRYAVMKGRQDIVNYLLESYGDSLRDQIEEIPAKE